MMKDVNGKEFKVGDCFVRGHNYGGRGVSIEFGIVLEVVPKLFTLSRGTRKGTPVFPERLLIIPKELVPPKQLQRINEYFGDKVNPDV
jgi:hypothetical protein